MPAAGPAGEAPVTQQAVTVLMAEHPAPASEKPPPARACDANPLADFGPEASKYQHYVLDAVHTPRKG